MIWIAKLFKARLAHILRRPYIWAFVLISAMAALFPVFGAAQGSRGVPVAVVDEDGGAQARQLAAYISEDSIMDITETDRDSALSLLSRGRLEGVFVIKHGFSEKILAGDFDDTVILYTSPSSSVIKTLSELLMGKAMELWAIELSYDEIMKFRASEGLETDDAYRAALRAEIEGAIHGEQLLSLERHTPEPEAAEPESPESRLDRSLLWYCAFIFFFMLISSDWVIEARGLALGDRMRSLGIAPWQGYAASSLAVIALSLSGAAAAGAAACLRLGLPAMALLIRLPALLLYLTASMGLTLLIASLLSHTVQLMLACPLAALLNAVLGGMITELPAWAGTLKNISVVLPGRMLTDYFMYGRFTALLLGAGLWIAFGVGVNLIRRGKVKGE